VFNRYGPTETTIAVTHVELTEDQVADGTVPLGHPHPGVTFLLVDDEDATVDGPDRPGELYIGGVQLMAGYWGSPELTARVLRTDLVPGAVVYRTGDVAYRNRRGEYVYVERADRVVKRSGVRISLVEVADAVRGLPGVADAACVVFDDEGAVGIAAFVVTDRPVDGLELRRGAARHLPDSMLPDRIERVPALPLTASGKLDERGLLGGAGLHPPRSGVPSAPTSRSA
jgi:acyl-coenzyme A synthetase/AMP-(fatty) acid ligase